MGRLRGAHKLNWLDLIVAVVLIGFAIRGLMKGFFRELFSLLGLFVGLWIALLQFVPVGEWLRTILPLTDPLPYHMAFLAIFLGVSIIASVLGFILYRVAKVFLVGWLDAVVGLGFGFVKGVMILAILLFLVRHLPLTEPVTSQLQNSTMVEHLELINPFVEQSIHAYKRVGGKRLWERLRVPTPNWSPLHGDRRTAEEALTR
jgi:membrane protein required for colicin V production